MPSAQCTLHAVQTGMTLFILMQTEIFLMHRLMLMMKNGFYSILYLFHSLTAFSEATQRKMYANLLKCGVDTENTHYVTYAPIDTPEPEFPQPEFFAEFILE